MSLRRTRSRPIAPDISKADAIRSDLAAARQLADKALAVSEGTAAEEAAEAAASLVLRLEAVVAALLPETVSLEIDEAGSAILVNGRTIRLSQQEFTLLSVLAANREQFTPRESLMRHLHGQDQAHWPDLRLVNVLVSSIRSKLRAATGRRDLIKQLTRRGWQLSDSTVEIIPPAPPVRWALSRQDL